MLQHLREPQKVYGSDYVMSEWVSEWVSGWVLSLLIMVTTATIIIAVTNVISAVTLIL